MRGLAAVVAVLLLAGCGGESFASESEPEITIEWMEVEDSIYGFIGTFQLPDGTFCAIYDGFRAGGLSCDWGANSRGAQR